MRLRPRFPLFALPLFTLLAACGPDKRPDEPCDGPSYNLVVTAEDGALPSDTRINVRSGSNPAGEAYELGQQTRGPAVFCDEDTTLPFGEGGANQGGSANSGEGTSPDVYALRCRLYTQGPASLDATATGYEPLADEQLPYDEKPHCRVPVHITLERERPDAGK